MFLTWQQEARDFSRVRLHEVTTTSKKLKFLSVEFNYDTINLPDATLNKTDWLSYDTWSAYNPLYLYNPINRNFFMSFFV